MFTEWLLGKQIKKSNDLEKQLGTIIELVSNLTVNMASMAGDLEEFKVRIEILESRLKSKNNLDKRQKRVKDNESILETVKKMPKSSLHLSKKDIRDLAKNISAKRKKK